MNISPRSPCCTALSGSVTHASHLLECLHRSCSVDGRLHLVSVSSFSAILDRQPRQVSLTVCRCVVCPPVLASAVSLPQLIVKHYTHSPPWPSLLACSQSSITTSDTRYNIQRNLFCSYILAKLISRCEFSIYVND